MYGFADGWMDGFVWTSATDSSPNFFFLFSFKKFPFVWWVKCVLYLHLVAKQSKEASVHLQLQVDWRWRKGSICLLYSVTPGTQGCWGPLDPNPAVREKGNTLRKMPVHCKTTHTIERSQFTSHTCLWAVAGSQSKIAQTHTQRTWKPHTERPQPLVVKQDTSSCEVTALITAPADTNNWSDMLTFLDKVF